MKRFILIAVAAAVAFGSSGRGQDQQPKLRDFMRRKLEHSKKALEGIVVKDFDLIAKSAQEMSLLSLDASWQVLQTPEYFERSSEFRRTANTLDRKAREKNLDGAALSYIQLTTQCFDCHKYVRDQTTGKDKPLDRINKPQP